MRRSSALAVEAAAHIGQIGHMSAEHFLHRTVTPKQGRVIWSMYPRIGLLLGWQQNPERFVDAHDIGDTFQSVVWQRQRGQGFVFIVGRARDMAE